jgi:SAM-dependent methyltransferase
MTHLTTADRLAVLMDHLGLARAHVATQVASDVAGFVAQHPERIGGLVLCAPTRLDPASFEKLAARLLLISGDKGLTAQTAESAQPRLPQARRHVLRDYAAAAWSDVIVDRGGEVAATMIAFLAAAPAVASAALPSRSGAHAGLTYRIEGAGPPLILLPFFLAPSQWDPAVPDLARHFTIIRLGGAHIGGVAALEDRARAPSYRAMFRTLVDLMAPEPTSRILDVGCGSGALDRQLAERLSDARIAAVDVNPFLQREAAALAADFGDRIRFAPGSATALPFPDRTFECVFSVTVLEECDAEKAIAEFIRVTRPGGRIAIVVRAIDLPQWWNLKLPPTIKAKADVPPQSVDPSGVADASLYARLLRAGLADLVGFPTLVTIDDPDGPIWRYREDHVLAQLTPAETETWNAARAAALAQGTLLHASALHCAVGRKPG